MRRLLDDRIRVARTLGVAGGLAGLLGVLVAVFVSGLDFFFLFSGENIEVSRTLVAMAWSLTGALGAVMSWKNPMVPGFLMGISGIAGIVTIPEYFSVGGILLLMGAVVALSIRTGEPVN